MAMSTILIEIRSAEGGDDAKLLLAVDMLKVYVKAAQRRGL